MAAWPDGVGREIHAELDSTNAHALREAARGLGEPPVWILAQAQRAARGRRGRPWAHCPGQFAATLLMHLPGCPAEAALRSFTAALALRDTVANLTRQPERFSLKWPNDVLLDGRKLAGILLESAPVPSGTALAIGIGVNLLAAPPASALEPEALAPIGLAAATGVRVEAERFLDLLAPRFAAWEARLLSDGFAPVRAAWLAGAARIGDPVTARLPGREIHGRFETLDADGALVLATAHGRIALPAAELHFAPVPEVRDAARH